MNEFMFQGHYLVTRSAKPAEPQDGWLSLATSNWTCLYREDDLVKVFRGSAPDRPDFLLIGYMIDPSAPEASDRDIAESILLGYKGPESLAERLYGLAGRFVLLVDAPDDTFVFHDACGLRPAYFHSDGAALSISSDPAVHGHFGLADLTYHEGFWGSAYQREDPEWWLPSGISLIPGVRQLPPNHYLQCSTATCVRYFPHASRPPAGGSDVIASAGALLKGSIAAAAIRWPLTLPLTAGVDSRTVLAASRKHMADIPVYTLQLEDSTTPSLDVQIATELCHIVGVSLNVVRPTERPSDQFEHAYKRSTVNAHFDRRGASIWNTRASFPGSVILNGNALEVARCFYYSSGTHSAITSPQPLLDLVKGWGQIDFIAEHVGTWFESTKDLPQQAGVDLLDLFYWEHRMGGWGAQNFTESGIAHEVFAPFNNRALLELLLTVPAAERCAPDYRLFRRLWQEMWPELLEPKVNPGARFRGLKSTLSKAGVLPTLKALHWQLKRIKG